MKKQSMILLGITCLFVMAGLFSPQQVLAAPLSQTGQPEQDVSFADIGYTQDIVLQGPYGRSTIIFSLPPEWQLLSGARLELNLSAYFSTFVIGQEEQNLDTINAGQLEVRFNGVSLPGEVLQGRGEKTLLLNLPEETLLPDPDSGLHRLEILWNAGATCEMNLTTSIVLHPESRLVLPYTLTTPAPALSRYPRPLIQTAPGLARQVVLVLPDRDRKSVV